MNSTPKEYTMHKLNEEDILSLGFKQNTLPYRFYNHKLSVEVSVGRAYNITIHDRVHDDVVFRGCLEYKHDLERVLKYIDV